MVPPNYWAGRVPTSPKGAGARMGVGLRFRSGRRTRAAASLLRLALLLGGTALDLARQSPQGESSVDAGGRGGRLLRQQPPLGAHLERGDATGHGHLCTNPPTVYRHKSDLRTPVYICRCICIAEFADVFAPGPNLPRLAKIHGTTADKAQHAMIVVYRDKCLSKSRNLWSETSSERCGNMPLRVRLPTHLVGGNGVGRGTHGADRLQITPRETTIIGYLCLAASASLSFKGRQTIKCAPGAHY